MKKLLLVLVSIISIQTFVFSQCTVDAGPDEYLCLLDSLNFHQIGGNPTASGGTPPYTYTWEARHVVAGIWVLTASDFLDDTTSANPIVTSYYIDEPVEFYLTVEDSDGYVCKDTMELTPSVFWFTNGYLNYYIDQGDSVFLYGNTSIGGGIEPVEYLWRPNHGLTDSSSSAFWAKPDHSVSYYPTITDAAGCVGTGGTSYQIWVNPVSVKEDSENNSRIKVYPNPSDKVLSFELEFNAYDQLIIEISNLKGQSVLKTETNGKKSIIDISGLQAGLYMYKILDKTTIVKEGKIIIK